MSWPVVVGGGWAGLAAAVELADAGRRPRLLEAGPRLGGRAATLPASGSRAETPPLDHGQHLLIGAYTAVAELLRRLGLSPDDAFVRVRPGLRVAADDGSDALALDLANLPAPLHSLVGIARLQGLSARERWRLMAGAKGVTPFSRPRPGETVASLLRRSGQSSNARARLWTPLCLATLNTAPEEASAELFSTVLHEIFRGPRRAAELWFPRRDLGALLAEPARAFIEARGGEVLTNHRVQRLLLEKGDCPHFSGVATREAAFHGPVVLAVAPWHAARLLRASVGGVTSSGFAECSGEASEGFDGASDSPEWGFGGAGRADGGRRESLHGGSQRPSMAAEAPVRAPHTPETRDDDAPPPPTANDEGAPFTSTASDEEAALATSEARDEEAHPASAARDGGGRFTSESTLGCERRDGTVAVEGGESAGFGVGGRGAGGFSGHGWPLRASMEGFTASPGATTPDTEAPDSTLGTRPPKGIEAITNLATHLEHLKPAPIDTVYLRYPEATRLEGPPLLGLEEPPSPWLIDRRTCGQPGWFGLAISARGPHSDWARDQLADWATRTIARLRPHWPKPLATVVIREKRATFAATPEAETHRPPPGPVLPGLGLAGDYTATGLPATLEGAVRSGVQCALDLIREGN